MITPIVKIDASDLQWLVDNVTHDLKRPLDRALLGKINDLIAAARREPVDTCRCGGRSDVWCTAPDCKNNPASGDLMPKDLPEPATVSVIMREGEDGPDLVLAVAETPTAAEKWTAIYNLGRISGTASYENHEVWR